MTGVVFFLSQLLGRQLRLSPLEVGAVFLIFTVPQLVSALSARRAIDRFGIRPTVTVALLVAVVGMALLSFATRTPAISPSLIVGMVLTGLGTGAAALGINMRVMGTVRTHLAGTASGVLQTSLQLGASVGIAVLVLIASVTSVTGAYVAAAGLMVLALACLSLTDRVVRKDESVVSEAVSHAH